MVVTFLIGNGFDVGMGLRSKFSDFFPIYCEESKNKDVSIKKLADNIEKNAEDWAYFERQIGIYTSNFDESNKSTFLNQLRDFEINFIKYLKEEETHISFKDTSKISQLMCNSLTSFYKNGTLPVASSSSISDVFQKRRDESITYNFLCFNYTSVLDNCLNTIENKIVSTHTTRVASVKDKIGRVVHVHGLCDMYPLMGVNDVSQIANQQLASDARFTRYIIKPELNRAHRMNFDKDGAAIINGSNIICVYGMSLGETDSIWWGRILDWLSADNNRQLVLFVYDSNYSTSSQFDWLQKEESIINQLQKYTSIDLSAEEIRDRIHISVHKNIFAMNLRDDLEEAEDISIDETLLQGTHLL